MGKLTARMQKAWRQTQRIFHFLVGLVFMFLAAFGISASIEAWHHHLDHPSIGLLRFYLFAAFTALLVFFCLFSFLKVRSIR